jgi:5-methylcytosine-specific restriction enzyme subunit McrC
MRTTDNNRGKLVSKLKFDTDELFDEDDLIYLSNNTINQLVNEDNLLIFPLVLNKNYKDIDGSNKIFELQNEENDDYKLTTSNLMGFVGRNDTHLTISSRFYPCGDDYFLHYMLQKVFAINVFDLKHTIEKESVWDFLLYLFPFFLKKSINQGLYKEYKYNEYNNANVKGAIDISGHIRINNPFIGKIAYRTREHSFDNKINQLVRHTIEYIRSHKFGSGILINDLDTHNAVSQIVFATPTYEKRCRINIINQNIKPLNHPYFTEYTFLQKICLQILNHEGLTYGKEKDKAYGLLFDGAWLWEEYLNTILKDRFIHPESRIGKHPTKLFENFQTIYPDFISKDKTANKSIVADAKYINLDRNEYGEEMALSIYYKTITYMYRFNSINGYLLFPFAEKPYVDKIKIKETLGTLTKLGLALSTNCADYSDFCKAMKSSEIEFKNNVI